MIYHIINYYMVKCYISCRVKCYWFRGWVSILSEFPSSNLNLKKGIHFSNFLSSLFFLFFFFSFLFFTLSKTFFFRYSNFPPSSNLFNLSFLWFLMPFSLFNLLIMDLLSFIEVFVYLLKRFSLLESKFITLNLSIYQIYCWHLLWWQQWWW